MRTGVCGISEEEEQVLRVEVDGRNDERMMMQS